VTWAGSAMFTAYVAHIIANDTQVRASWGGATTTRFKFAMFHSAVTPDRDAPDAETFYGEGTWTPDEELTGGSWPPGGIAGAAQINPPTVGVTVQGWVALVCPLITGTGVIIDDLAGDLFYDGTGYSNPGLGISVPPGRGLAFHDYGGSLDVAGTLTVTWPYPPGCVCLNSPT
jgi:hypothetical protein